MSRTSRRSTHIAVRPRLALAAALAATLALGATAGRAAPGWAAEEPGVTATSILLGATVPLSDPSSAASAAAIGAGAYFRHVNAKGGVNGRQISLRYLDDAADPAQALQLTKQLVEQDRVFAIVGAAGTEHVLAVREYLNTARVPQLVVGSGAAALAGDAARNPYTIGFRPSYAAEGWVYGKYLGRTQGAARIAVLYQNDGDGRELLSGLRKGLRRSRAKIVAAEAFEPRTDVSASVARLKASRADVLAVFAVDEFPVQAYAVAARIGWRPKLVVTNALAADSSVMTTAGESGTNKLVDATISGVFVKDPSDPAWRTDAGLALYRQLMRRYAPTANAKVAQHVYGMAVAYTIVEALKRTGKSPTRDALLKAVTSLNVSSNPFLVPGVILRTGPGDRLPVEQLVLQRWQKGSWRSFGGVWAARPA